MQYLNTMLWDNFDSVQKHVPLSCPKSPIINCISENWQRTKCDLLGLPFHSISKQPVNYNGKLLENYEPWETENIVCDGNCLFRCFSHIITSSQNSHQQLRAIITHFIASEGISQLGWYFKSKRLTPCEYFLTENLTSLEGT